MIKKFLIALCIISFYFAVSALADDEMGYGQSHEGSPHLVLCHSKKKKQAPKPTYHKKTDTWTCPEGWTVVAGENDLMAGKLWVACSR